MLAELKRAATLLLDRHAQLRLLGMDPAHARPGDVPARLELYDRLRPHLPAAVATALDSRREYEVAFGLGHCGRSDVINHDIQVRSKMEGGLCAWCGDAVAELTERQCGGCQQCLRGVTLVLETAIVNTR